MLAERLLLLAEDDPDDEVLIRHTLSEHRVECDVAVVRDGAELIDYLFGSDAYVGRGLKRTPGLILLDLKMPKMDGLKVLQLLRRVRPNDQTTLPPVVVFSSSSEQQDILEAYRLGAYSYIRKPVSYEQFRDAVVHVVKYWLELNQPPPRLCQTVKPAAR